MNTLNLIRQQLDESITSKQNLLQLSETIVQAGELLANCIQRGNKILCCGNGGSASDAQHFAAELVGRYVKERPGMPAICLNTDTSALTAIGNDYGYDQVFARQIQALGQANDVLLAITTSGNSENIIRAIEAAHIKQMQVLVLTGKGGGRLKDYLLPSDLQLCVPSNTTSRIQEAHIFMIHCFCEVIDYVCMQQNI
jgi:D-sedoheptulose 7-phosphate isomerase